MNKKLSIEKQNELLEIATRQFGERGLSGVSVQSIASEADLSVGVIYKYYDDKDALFRACIRHSLASLTEVLENEAKNATSLEEMCRDLIRASIRYAKAHPSYFRMYHEITSAGSASDARAFAESIEKTTAEVYTNAIAKAQADGVVSSETAPERLAFFFDNLLMMLHFSFACEYYRERMNIYLGDDVADDTLEEELTAFILRGAGVRV